MRKTGIDGGRTTLRSEEYAKNNNRKLQGHCSSTLALKAHYYTTSYIRRQVLDARYELGPFPGTGCKLGSGCCSTSGDRPSSPPPQRTGLSWTPGRLPGKYLDDGSTTALVQIDPAARRNRSLLGRSRASHHPLACRHSSWGSRAWRAGTTESPTTGSSTEAPVGLHGEVINPWWQPCIKLKVRVPPALSPGEQLKEVLQEER